ncbi:hypothetical protein BACI_pBAslCI1400060 (plasmid) [Bacillus cereus biovar anthracis str. CI]|nr:hypothetical protein BACI_pBAslCI1400060 [Bacillus cereus biovar anthracis str. CI]
MTKLQDLYKRREELGGYLKQGSDVQDEKKVESGLTNNIINDTEVTGTTERNARELELGITETMKAQAQHPLNLIKIGELSYFEPHKSKSQIFEEVVGMKYAQYKEVAPDKNRRAAISFVENIPVENQLLREKQGRSL